jgi:membrane protein YqaA with SNARE-associated domain
VLSHHALLTCAHLAGLALLNFVGNGVFPFPISAYVLWLAQWLPIGLIVGVATLSSVAGWAVFLRVSSRFSLKAEAALAKVPKSYRQWFHRSPGLSLFLANAVPFPADPVRVIAWVEGYSTPKTLAWLCLGRLVRFSLLGVLGHWLAQFQQFFTVILVGFVLIPLFMHLGRQIKRPQPPSQQIDTPKAFN